MCIILMVHLLVVSVIVALTKNKVQIKYHIIYHFTLLGFIVLKKESKRKKKKKKTALNFNIRISITKQREKKTTTTKKNYEVVQCTTRVSFQEQFS